MFFKKTIVLSGKGGKGEKAVLNIEKTEEGFAGNLKLYQFSEEPSGILSLGFLPENGKVTKCGLTKSGFMNYCFALNEKMDLNVFSCALIQIDKGQAMPILLGTHNQAKQQTLEEKLAFSSELIAEQPTMQQAKEALDTHNIHLEDQEEIEKQIDCEMKHGENASPCVSCPYRKTFFESNSEVKSEKVDANINDVEAKNETEQIHFEKPVKNANIKQNPAYAKPQNSKPNQALHAYSVLEKAEEQQEEMAKPNLVAQDNGFYAQIQEELSELFSAYPRETVLEKIVPESKWVRVNLDNEDEHYVVGTIEENGQLKYICYGIPGIYSGKPPKQIEKYAQWLPLDIAKPNEVGYWMTYQEAQSGESIRIVI